MITKDQVLLPLPWHRNVWATWYKVATLNKLPHALLLKGPVGSGKLTFIQLFAKLILCAEPKQFKKEALYYACGTCSSCLSYHAGAHPNYYEIKPTCAETGKPKIFIDQIRQLTQTLQQTAKSTGIVPKQHGYHTVVVIGSAHLLNTAQHALLKTLEEPNVGILFLLASDRPEALEPTIRSRCQSLSLPQPERKQATAWLKQALLKHDMQWDDATLLMAIELTGNIPVRTLEYLKTNQIEGYNTLFQSLVDLTLNTIHPLDATDRWMQYPFETVLDYLAHALKELIQFKLGSVATGASNREFFTISTVKMAQCCQEVSLTCLFACWDKLIELRSDMDRYHLNASIALDMLAYTFSSSKSFS